MLLAELEQIDGPGEIVLDQLARTRATVRAGEHAGVGGGINHPIDRRQGLQITRGAEVAVEQLHAEPLQLRAIGFAARADEVVEAAEFVAGPALDERARERAAHEAANAGDEDAHRPQHAKIHRRGKRDL